MTTTMMVPTIAAFAAIAFCGRGFAIANFSGTYRCEVVSKRRELAGRTYTVTQCMVRPCVARGFFRVGGSGLASMYPTFDWNVSCSWPSWISARVRAY